MLDEARPEVREWYELELRRRQEMRQRLEGRSHVGTMAWLLDHGVLTKEQAADQETRRAYGWLRQARGAYEEDVFSTVRLENIEVDSHASGAVWFLRQNLDPEFRDGGLKRDQGQRARTVSWRRLLERTRASPTSKAVGFRALIVENSKRGEALLSGESAGIKSAVLDSERWFVHQWDDTNHRAVLVRGVVPSGWHVPGEHDEQMEDVGEGNDPDEGDPFTFPDSGTRKRIERAAVDYVIRELGRRYDWRSVENEIPKPGYDLIFSDRRSGATVLKVEVKGTSRPEEHFYISRNEVGCAKIDPQWRLIIVFNALTDPQFYEPYTWFQVKSLFDLESMAYEGKPVSAS